MAKPLVVVESPAKAKTISKFLGDTYDVRASVGHVADLPSKDALRAQIVGAVQGPMGKIVTLLTAVQGELARVLEARSKQGAAE